MTKHADKPDALAAHLDGVLEPFFRTSAAAGPVTRQELASMGAAVKTAILSLRDGPPDVVEAKERKPRTITRDGVHYDVDEAGEEHELVPFNEAGDMVRKGGDGTVIAAADIEGGRVAEKGTQSTTIETGTKDLGVGAGVSTGAGRPDSKGENAKEQTEVKSKGPGETPDTSTKSKVDEKD
jgi:hypothetical protein